MTVPHQVSSIFGLGHKNCKFQYFLSKLSREELKDKVLLDLGSFTGGRLIAWAENYKLKKSYGIDINPIFKIASEEFAREKNINADFSTGIGEKLPYDDNFFDFIVSTDTFEHVQSLEKSMEECYRVLKPGGKFLASVPAEFPEKICWMLSKEYQNQPGGHLRIFKKKLLIKDIEDKGFIFDASERFHSIHSAYWWLRCLFWKSQDSNFLVSWYKKFLELHILKKPTLIRLLG